MASSFDSPGQTLFGKYEVITEVGKWQVMSYKNFYQLPTNLREGSDFTGVCHSVRLSGGIEYPEGIGMGVGYPYPGVVGNQRGGRVYLPPLPMPLRWSIRILLECFLVLFIFNSVSWEIYTRIHKERRGGVMVLHVTESREKENNKNNIHKMLTFTIDRGNNQTYCGIPL